MNKTFYGQEVDARNLLQGEVGLNHSVCKAGASFIALAVCEAPLWLWVPRRRFMFTAVRTIL
jgi:hypothetical protein